MQIGRQPWTSDLAPNERLVSNSSARIAQLVSKRSALEARQPEHDRNLHAPRAQARRGAAAHAGVWPVRTRRGGDRLVERDALARGRLTRERPKLLDACAHTFQVEGQVLAP